MTTVRLGKSELIVPKNGFGALPIQRISLADTVHLLHKALDNGMYYFDTARFYTDSEEKLGAAFADRRDRVVISTKTGATTADGFWRDLDTSLRLLRTDYIDLYQFHNPAFCPKPGDGTGLYEAMLQAREQGKVRHIGITNHRLAVAHEAIDSGLYETLQFPFSYLASDKELDLVNLCKEHDMGFIAMKGLSGGLLTDSKACMAFMSQFDALPIWGIQRQSELDEWLSYFDNDVSMTDEIRAFIDKDRNELLGEFCRGCGYCMPCTVDITINQCARMSQMIRRAPSQNWLTDHWQQEMLKIDSCVDCGLCKTRCPYELDIPNLLKKNLKDYKEILAGKPV